MHRIVSPSPLRAGSLLLLHACARSYAGFTDIAEQLMHRDGEPLVRPAPGSDLLTEAECAERDALFEENRPYADVRAEFLAHVQMSMHIILRH
jgi:hypothetical protein